MAGVALAFSLSIAPAIHAQPDPERIKSENEFLSRPKDEWSEAGQVTFPGAPRETDLVRFDLDSIGTSYEYFIDPTSVSLGPDEVLRYTVVLKSKAGVRNIFYEGIRCATAEFKTYAYAAQDGDFKPLESPIWKKLRNTQPYDYRRLLAEHYVCDQNGWALGEKQVRKRIAQNDPNGLRVRPKPGYFQSFGN